MAVTRIAFGDGELAPGQTTMALSLPVAIASNQGSFTVANGAGTAYIGQTASPIQFVTVDFAVQTTALDVGDVIADTQVVTGATRAADACAILDSITVIDVDDQKAVLSVVLMDSNQALGTEDSAPDIDDTEVQAVQGIIAFVAADYVDLGANSVAHRSNLGIVVKPATGTANIYAALYTPSTSTPTYAGGHIYVRFGFRSQ